MKTTLAFSLLLVASLIPVTTAQAGSSAARGALIGGVAGAIIGSSGDRHDVLAGAAFGATAGALLGAASDNSRGHGHGYSHGGRSHVSVSYGFGYGHGYRPYYHHSHYRPYHRHAYYGWGYPSIYYSYSRPVYYSSNYDYVRPVQVVTAPEAQPAAVTQPAQPAQSSPQNVTIINNYYGGSSSMSSANGMFGR